MTTILFVFHGLCAVLLIGAVTHQAMAVWWPVTSGSPHFVTRFRAVNGRNYVNAIIILFIVTFIFGAVVYPVYRIGARIYMENLKLSAAVGSFEMKEHLASFGLALLPAYWFYWRNPQAPETATPRKILTLMIAIAVWSSFLIGYVLNNIRGI